MQSLANTLNYVTTPWSHHIAFETVDTPSLFEKWNDGQTLNVILVGRLKVTIV